MKAYSNLGRLVLTTVFMFLCIWAIIIVSPVVGSLFWIRDPYVGLLVAWVAFAFVFLFCFHFFVFGVEGLTWES